LEGSIEKTKSFSQINMSKNNNGHYKSMDLRNRSQSALVHKNDSHPNHIPTEPQSSGKKYENLPDMNHWDLADLRRSSRF
jgi:hypothetical protein